MELAGLGLQLGSTILKPFFNLNDSMILYNYNLQVFKVAMVPYHGWYHSNSNQEEGRILYTLMMTTIINIFITLFIFRCLQTWTG